MRIPTTMAAFLLLTSILKAQDSLQKPLRITVNAELMGRQHYYSVNALIHQPAMIKYRRQLSTQLPINFDTITDNPFRHGAMYIAAKSTVQFKNKIFLSADLYGEYRGFSYGTFDVKNNLVVFPVIALAGRDSFHIGHHIIFADGKVGQFLNERLDEGLMIYNLDVQGTQIRLRNKNTRFGFTIYGDLYNAIGLNIDDLKEFSLEQLARNDSVRFGVSLTLAAPPYAPAKYHSYFSAFGSASFSKSIRIYSQLGFLPVYKNTYFDQNFLTQIAFVVGVEKDIRGKRISLANRTELRYYGQNFNLLHSDPLFRYRDPASNKYEMYANTVGRFLYPLRKFDTPFSQWAVFTEYVGCNVWALTSSGDVSYMFANNLSLRLDYDLNAIRAVIDKIYSTDPGESRLSFFVYPYFKTSFQYFLLKEANVAIFVTNKSMSLDLSYPTHYLNRNPFVGIEFYCKI